MKFPKLIEPLVTAESNATRQDRRKARRAEARSLKRKGAPVRYETVATAGPPAPVMTAPGEVASVEAEPLPRNRSLAKPPSALMMRLNAWLSRLVPLRSARPPASFDRCSPEALAEQMAALRAELAQVQGRLDRMISAVSPRL